MDLEEDFKRLPRHCSTAIQTKVIFEQRVQKQEVVGQRFRASQRRKKPGGYAQTPLSARSQQLANTGEALDTSNLEGSQSAADSEAGATAELQVIEPWYASRFWATVTATGGRAEALPGLKRRSPKEPRAPTAWRPPSSKRSPPSTTPGNSDGAFGTPIRREPLLPRPAVPKLPDAAAAACWPGGNARWRWAVPLATPSTASLPPASASTAQAAAEDNNFLDAAPEEVHQHVEEVKQRVALHQPWWEMG